MNREKVSLGGSLYLARKWLAYTQVIYDHNLELQLDRRVTFLGGPGYKVAQSNKSLVTVMEGAAFTRESYYGEDSVKNADGVFGIDAQFFKLYSPRS